MKKSELKALIRETIQELRRYEPGDPYHKSNNLAMGDDGDQMEEEMREDFINAIAEWQGKGADRKMIEFAFQSAFRYLEEMRD